MCIFILEEKREKNLLRDESKGSSLFCSVVK